MPNQTESLEVVTTEQLEQVTGGNPAAIGSQIGGLVDSFTGGNEGAQIGGQIGGLVGSFLG